jgi:ubiquinone/menaquinone biosynthesis C-methylase UbiE
LTQDKRAEIDTGEGTPEMEWLEGYQSLINANRKRLGLLGILPCKGLKVLDAGCGPGNFGLIMAKEGASVTGVDISPEAIEVAQKRATMEGVDFTPQVGDIEKLPFADDTFDICFSGWTLHHFPDLTVPIAELKRVLKLGGRLTFVEPNESSPAMKLSRFFEDLPIIRKWILKAGWDTPNRTVHRHYHYLDALKRVGFTDIKIHSRFFGAMKHLPLSRSGRRLNPIVRMALPVFFTLRTIAFYIVTRLSPPPLNGIDLLVVVKK